MRELAVKIWIEDETTCHNGCPFLLDTKCLLFKQDLKKTKLPDGHVWQQGLTRQRCGRCIQSADI